MDPMRSLCRRLRRRNCSHEERSGRVGGAHGISRGFGPGYPYRMSRDELKHVLRDVTLALGRRSQRWGIEKGAKCARRARPQSLIMSSADLLPAEHFSVRSAMSAANSLSPSRERHRHCRHTSHRKRTDRRGAWCCQRLTCSSGEKDENL